MADRLFIVTGGSRGIGRALLGVAGDHGDHTASISRNGTPAESHLTADLADPTSWNAVIDWMSTLIESKTWGSIGLVHNAATLDPIGFAGEVGAADLQRQVQLNFAAPFVIGAGFLQLVQGLPTSSILVQMTSGAARTAYPGWSGYGPAKAAVDHWVRTVAIELGLRGALTTVLAVAPGVVDTAMQRQIRETPSTAFPEVERFRDMHETGSLATPENVAERLYRIMWTGELESGAVVDLRGLD